MRVEMDVKGDDGDTYDRIVRHWMKCGLDKSSILEYADLVPH